VIEERTLVDGGQTAEAIAERLVAWLGEARSSLDIALYDVRLPGAIGDGVADAIRAAADRVQPRRRPHGEAAAASPAHRALAARAARRAVASDPRRSRPHAPQVRRA
jgi:hypothetical protein